MQKIICEYCGVEKYMDYGAHLAKCIKWKIRKNEIISGITKQFLYNEHIINLKSVYEISKNLGLRSTHQIILKLKEFNLPILNYKNDEKRKKLRIKRAKITSFKKYGYEFHLSKGSKIRDKLNKNIFDKYGVKNIRQTEYVKNIIKDKIRSKYGVNCGYQIPEIVEKVKKTCLKKYGVDNIFKSSLFKSKKFKRMRLFKQKYKISKQAYSLFNFLYINLINNGFKKSEIYCLPHTKEFGKYVKKRYCFYDFVIPKLKFCVEYNGNYYHANKRMYSENDVILGKKANDIWADDKEKIDFIRNKGFDTWIIWEYDYKKAENFYKTKILQYILNKNINDNKENFESNILNDLK